MKLLQIHQFFCASYKIGVCDAITIPTFIELAIALLPTYLLCSFLGSGWIMHPTGFVV
jgi:hypothetical protein